PPSSIHHMLSEKPKKLHNPLDRVSRCHLRSRHTAPSTNTPPILANLSAALFAAQGTFPPIGNRSPYPHLRQRRETWSSWSPVSSMIVPFESPMMSSDDAISSMAPAVMRQQNQ